MLFDMLWLSVAFACSWTQGVGDMAVLVLVLLQSCITAPSLDSRRR